MEFDVNNWVEELKQKILNEFKERVLFIGFQGSYCRGEATPNSDVDMVVILDKLEIEDLKRYKRIVNSMPFKEKACGFISGKKEIANWSKSDLFQFVYDTKPLFGKINDIVPPITEEDIKKSVKTSAQNLYHAACHSFLFDENLSASLAGLYKMTFFILQSKYFLRTQEYIPTKKLLVEKLDGTDRQILDICINKDQIKNRPVEKTETERLYKNLIDWCSDLIV